MYKYAFPGEVLLGAFLFTGSLHLVTPKEVADLFGPVAQTIPPARESSSTTTS
jgi:hypothetical protein